VKPAFKMDVKLRKTKKRREKRGKDIRNNVNPAIKYRKLILYCIHNVIWLTSSTCPLHLCIFTFCLNPEHHIPNTKHVEVEEVEAHHQQQSQLLSVNCKLQALLRTMATSSQNS
jgi:hypothetical protein